ncbi:DUF1641 domain-containing protein [Peribacillus sp. B-H-3]|jgi:uncharacterized protein YjgD (DUF1641 family)|uniref:DUF1641 domain-containing protein n=1 Tax=Peribacillus sp. B-H-3 TaxID=3400420 RepID=UPI003B01E818
MAKAIRNIERIKISEEDKRKQDLEEIEHALLKNKDAILESLQVMEYMQSRGVLAMMNGLLGQSEKVLDILVKTADRPETTNMLKNLLLMVGTLGVLDVKQLEPVILKVNSGIARVAEAKDTEEKTSYFDLVRSLKDPEINRALTFMLTFLKGMGQDTKEQERNTMEPHHQEHEKRKNRDLR